jgi:hypothetical protein
LEHHVASSKFLFYSQEIWGLENMIAFFFGQFEKKNHQQRKACPSSNTSLQPLNNQIMQK